MITVELVEFMGSDLLVANAARRSFGVEHSTFRAAAEGPRKPGQRSDEELIWELAQSGHLLPFRHPHATLSCAAPVPIARQLGKHQVGMEWSEISRRYKVGRITFHRLDGAWRADVADRRQGSGALLPPDVQYELEQIQRQNIGRCLEDFELALALGAAPEHARFLLPLSLDILWTWTGSLLAWAHLWNQRHHADAQTETRQFAEAAAAIIEPLFPVSWAALTRDRGTS